MTDLLHYLRSEASSLGTA